MLWNPDLHTARPFNDADVVQMFMLRGATVTPGSSFYMKQQNQRGGAVGGWGGGGEVRCHKDGCTGSGFNLESQRFWMWSGLEPDPAPWNRGS